MNTRSFTWELIGALSGAVSVAFFVAAGAVGGGPILDPSNSAAELAQKIDAAADDIQLGTLIPLFSLLSFVWFLGYLRLILQEAEGETGWLTPVVFGGGLLLVAVSLGFAATSFAMEDGTDPQVAKVLVALQWNYAYLFAPPLIAFMAAVSAVIIRFRVLPRWLGWIGLLVTLTSLMPWIGIFTFQVWILIASLVLVTKVVRLQRSKSA